MAKFIDHHSNMPELSPDVMKSLQDDMRAGKRDKNGVKTLNAYFGPGGQAWCITEAGSADAVCKHHKDIGLEIDCSTVTEVKSAI